MNDLYKRLGAPGLVAVATSIVALAVVAYLLNLFGHVGTPRRNNVN